MVTNAKSGRQDTKDEERLRRGLVLDIVLNGIRQQQSRLEVHLRQDQTQQNGGIRRFTDAIEVGGDAQLGDRDRSRTDPLGRVDAKGDGKGLQAKRAVSFDRLEVIDNGDSETSNGVEDGAVGMV